jgi:hypothetical protein
VDTDTDTEKFLSADIRATALLSRDMQDHSHSSGFFQLDSPIPSSAVPLDETFNVVQYLGAIDWSVILL